MRFEERGLILKPRLGRSFTVACGEILTVERLRRGVGLRLHTRTLDRLRLSVRGARMVETEALLRERGIRTVDCWGGNHRANVSGFRARALKRPPAVRQSSDNA
jgi:hypothetical protein